MRELPENFATLRAVELAQRGIAWLALGFMAAPTWFGRRLSRAANDERFT